MKFEWLSVALLLLGIELLAGFGVFYFLVLSAAAVIAWLSQFIGFTTSMQFLVFAVATTLGTLTIRTRQKKSQGETKNYLVGEMVTNIEWFDAEGGRGECAGTFFAVKRSPGSRIETSGKVKSVEGSTLIVE